jgi:hypothetical protein
MQLKLRADLYLTQANVHYNPLGVNFHLGFSLVGLGLSVRPQWCLAIDIL